MELNQELLTRLDILAAKLGQTGGHLWQIILQNGKTEMITCWTYAGIWMLMALFINHVRVKLNKLVLTEGIDDAEVKCIGINGFAALFGFVCLAFAIGAATNAMQWILSPEYNALKLLIKDIR